MVRDKFSYTAKRLEKVWRKQQNNPLDILFLPYNNDEIEKIRQAHISKHNLNHENQLILLMNTEGKKWHYLAVKHLSPLLR